MTAPEEPQPPAAPPAERFPFWGYRDVFMLTVLGLMVSFVVAMASQFLFPTTHLNAFLAIGMQFVLELLWFAILFGAIKFGYDRPFWRSLGWVPSQFTFWQCAGVGVACAAVFITIGSLLPHPPGKNLMEQLLRDRPSILVVGIFAITLGPFFEEIVFRGFLMPLFMRTFGMIAGLVLQAIAFAALHGTEYKWAWQQMILMFLAGMAFGWMRQKSGSTRASTYMHAGYNVVPFVGMFVYTFFE